MATFTLMKDDMKTCPYNPLHRVSARRLQQHIVKCSKNTSNPVLVDCPFNALHKMPAQELQQHILLCKDSRQVIREIENSRNRTTTMNRPVINRSDNLIQSDDWTSNDDTKGKTYVIPGLRQDSEEDESKPFAIKSNIEIQCLRPSERKKYYKDLVENSKSRQMVENSGEDNKRQSDDSFGSKSGSMSSKYDLKNEREDEIRRPLTNPFKPRLISGIGRGVVPSTNRMQINRNQSQTTDIKRERSGGQLGNGSKRFSPDI